MKKIINRIIIILVVMVLVCREATSQSATINYFEEEDDTLIWTLADKFTSTFNKGDTAVMVQLIPDDFILQWMHENFLGKKGVIRAMTNPTTHSALKHQWDKDEGTSIRFSDDRNTASINVAFEFLDKATSESIKKGNGYGLCIMYFQKGDGVWKLKTIHLDLHCTLCNF